MPRLSFLGCLGGHLEHALDCLSNWAVLYTPFTYTGKLITHIIITVLF